ncbi:MAG: rhomboid family intramembrane serine protease [Phycisphaerae bacterium]
MLVVIPIRTQSVSRRTPSVNYVLIAVNVFLFFLFNQLLTTEPMLAFKMRHLVFHAEQPAFYQFFTYQFLHADIMHLLGNMLFLWVFGNSVNVKMGDGPYLLFYLAGGVFAAWGYALVKPFPLVGASGAIAAVTTAYLALFPRSHVTVLVWVFIFIRFFELPAMIIIGLKIIVWDNIIAPNLGREGSVAHTAHLAGYLFGFASALGMLFIRALPRDQFDILALWKRWHQRREFAAAMSDPAAVAQAQYGPVAREAPADPQQQAAEERHLDEITDLRGRISEQIERGDVRSAAALYEQLVVIDPVQCLSERHQMELAREFYGSGRFPQAAASFERFVDCYAHSSQVNDIRLLLGIIYARDLQQYEVADKHLSRSMETLRDQTRRDQCLQWLRDVRTALGRPAPET